RSGCTRRPGSRRRSSGRRCCLSRRGGRPRSDSLRAPSTRASKAGGVCPSRAQACAFRRLRIKTGALRVARTSALGSTAPPPPRRSGMLSCVRVRWMLSLLLLSACAPEPEAPAPPREGAEARGEPEEAAAAPPTHLVHEGIEVRVLEDGRVSV